MKFTEEHKAYIDSNFKLMRMALINLGALKYTEEGWEAPDMKKASEAFLQQFSDSVENGFQAVIRVIEAQSIQIKELNQSIKDIPITAAFNFNKDPEERSYNVPLTEKVYTDSETPVATVQIDEMTTEGEVNTPVEEPKKTIKAPIVNGRPRLKERIKAEKESPPVDLLADQVSRNALNRK